MQNMFQAFEGTDAQDKGSIRNLVNSLLHRENTYSRGAKHGLTQAQYDHFKANESTRHAKKKQHSSITDRWHRDELCRNSEIAIGWTEEYCQYLDSFMSSVFSDTATRKERERYENNYTLGVNSQRPKPGQMKKRTDFPQAVNKVMFLRRQVENPNPYIPKHSGFRP